MAFSREYASSLENPEAGDAGGGVEEKECMAATARAVCGTMAGCASDGDVALALTKEHCLSTILQLLMCRDLAVVHRVLVWVIEMCVCVVQDNLSDPNDVVVTPQNAAHRAQLEQQHKERVQQQLEVQDRINDSRRFDVIQYLLGDMADVEADQLKEQEGSNVLTEGSNVLTTSKGTKPAVKRVRKDINQSVLVQALTVLRQQSQYSDIAELFDDALGVLMQ